jgi:hypothetical protein
MVRILLTGIVVLAALLPIAPMVIAAVALTVIGIAFGPAVTRLEKQPAAFEQRLCLAAVASFRGPPAAASR